MRAPESEMEKAKDLCTTQCLLRDWIRNQKGLNANIELTELTGQRHDIELILT